MHPRSTEVLGMRTSAYKFPSGRKLTRMPHLASPLLRINLAEELRRLRSEQSWKRGSGRSSKTLAKYPDFHMVLVLMKANTQMHKHHVDARISIQALEGRLRVRLTDQVVALTAGGLIALGYGVTHDIEAGGGRGLFYNTFFDPGGKEEKKRKKKKTVWERT